MLLLLLPLPLLVLLLSLAGMPLRQAPAHLNFLIFAFPGVRVSVCVFLSCDFCLPKNSTDAVSFQQCTTAVARLGVGYSYITSCCTAERQRVTMRDELRDTSGGRDFRPRSGTQCRQARHNPCVFLWFVWVLRTYHASHGFTYVVRYIRSLRSKLYLEYVVRSSLVIYL